MKKYILVLVASSLLSACNIVNSNDAETEGEGEPTVVKSIDTTKVVDSVKIEKIK